jgi:hypothetical protein
MEFVAVTTNATTPFQTIFALSQDTKFTPNGDVTRIPYQRYYEEYSQYLHAGLKSGDQHVKALFDAWNARLFPHIKAKGSTSGPSASLQRALKSIQRPSDSAGTSDGSAAGVDASSTPASSGSAPAS